MALATPASVDRFVRTNDALPARDMSRPAAGGSPPAPPESLSRPREYHHLNSASLAGDHLIPEHAGGVASHARTVGRQAKHVPERVAPR